MKQIFLCLSFLFYSFLVSAQFDHIAVHPTLNGEPLLNAVVADFKPGTVLAYGPARDSLYANIDVKNDSIECVYTGHKLYLDPSLDPTQALFLDGDKDGINTEHSYPQSKGAEKGNAKSDMHHLYPTRAKANNDRGSLPFADIPDVQTKTWYFKTFEQPNIPNLNIDNYSEGTDSQFEPRESHKGDVARSMMYFYTMYRSEAMAADPLYFESQREILCEWHNQDAVDEKEWNRSMGIAQYQEGKANPFVLDCTLASRLYCEEASLACQMTGTISNEPNLFSLYPNPGYDRINISSEPTDHKYSIYNYLGVEMISGSLKERTYEIDISTWEKGFYFIRVVSDSHNQYQTLTFLKI